MKVTISCPKGSYDPNMRIRCAVTGSVCAHQYWCPCEGRCKLTDRAAKCPGRNEDTSGREKYE